MVVDAPLSTQDRAYLLGFALRCTDLLVLDEDLD